MATFLWNLNNKSTEKLTKSVQENTDALRHLDGQLKETQKVFAEFPKMKTDLNRLFTATKLLAGPQWPEIRSEIMKEEEIR